MATQMTNNYSLSALPPSIDLETTEILKYAIEANKYLAELKGVAKTIPNQSILINALPLLEAKESSEIENIITTHDEMYKAELFSDLVSDSSTKEVQNYARALRTGYEKIRKQNILSNSLILEVQEIIENNRAGFRKLPGTELKNEQTGETIYTPPQNHEEIQTLMKNLERVINEDSFMPIDPLIKMAVIHYQFESIHPFYDGNGRTGRILNILYLVHQELLDLPLLYMSRYIIKNKTEYYQLLQSVREKQDWHKWIIYMLKGVEATAKETIILIEEIKKLMQDYKYRIRADFRFYSQELLNNLFCHPYTKIEYLEKDMGVSRQTASKYLDQLHTAGFLDKQKIGNHNFYINKPLFNLFTR